MLGCKERYIFGIWSPSDMTANKWIDRHLSLGLFCAVSLQTGLTYFIVAHSVCIHPTHFLLCHLRIVYGFVTSFYQASTATSAAACTTALTSWASKASNSVRWVTCPTHFPNNVFQKKNSSFLSLMFPRQNPRGNSFCGNVRVQTIAVFLSENSWASTFGDVSRNGIHIILIYYEFYYLWHNGCRMVAS